MVADPRAPGASRPSRLNQPQAALVDEAFDGTPRQVNRQPVAVVREEWRVVDRWWTEEPVSRRYFEVVQAEAGTFFAAQPGATHGFRNSGRPVLLNVHGPDGGFAEGVRSQ